VEIGVRTGKGNCLNSPYKEVGARLVDNGYSAIPIMPGTKRPGNYTMREWYGTAQWQRFCDRKPTEIETGIWEKWPDAGVCVALDHKLKVIDIDTDDVELMTAVLSVLPDTRRQEARRKRVQRVLSRKPGYRVAAVQCQQRTRC
jgi:hypothetical protein